MFTDCRKNSLKLCIIPFMVVIFILCLIACSSINKKEISDEVVLKVGPVEITKYEFERNKERDFNPKSNSYKQWFDNYIDETYILADAYNKKYDTLTEIRKVVDYAAHSMISEVGGYLWEKTEQPKLNFSNSEIKRIYKRRDKTFYFEYLQFPEKATMTKLIGSDTIVKTDAGFNKIMNKCQLNTLVKYNNMKFLYPFDELEPFKDILYDLEQGAITKPLYTNTGIYIIHLKRTENRNEKPFNDEKEQIRSYLQITKQNQIVENKQKEVFDKANIIINTKVENTMLEMLKKYNEQYLLNKQASLKESTTNGNDTLMSYTFNKQRKYFLIKDFIDYYTNNPLMFVINDMEALHELIKDYVIEQYLYIEAENLGITNEKRYLLDKRNFTNKLLVQHYNEKEFNNNAHVTDEEIQNYYRDKKQDFSEAQMCYVSILTFKNRGSAYFKYENIKERVAHGDFKCLSDTSLKGLISRKDNVPIKPDNKEYPKVMVQNVFDLPVNNLSRPFDMDNLCILFVKTKQEGERIKTYDEVKDKISQQLTSGKINTLRNDRIKELKKKYPISITMKLPQ